MEKYTPGPWKVDTGTLDDDTNPRHVMASDGDYTCTAYGDTPQEADANAALIASSPELLDELRATVKTLVDALDNMAYLWDKPITPEAQAWRNKFKATVSAARAAIAKATA